MFIGPVTLISVEYWGHITPKYNFTAILMYTIPLESDSQVIFLLDIFYIKLFTRHPELTLSIIIHAGYQIFL